MIEILLISLASFYALMSIVSSFIFIISDWEGFCITFDKDERTAAIIVLVIFGPAIIAAALAINLANPLLARTIWRDNTKKVAEETVSSSLSKVLKNYNKYFEKK